MSKRTLTAGFVATTIFAFSIVAGGCKKEEPKEAAPVAAPEAPQSTAPAVAPATSGDIFKAQLTTDAPPQSMKAGATVIVPIRVKNVSGGTWTRDKAKPINLSYHWKSPKDNKAVVWDGTRMFIPKELVPGEETIMNAQITAPKAVGEYRLELDMVLDAQEGGWFGKKGSEIKAMQVTVK